MRIHRYSDAGEFLRRSESWLIEAEAENNLMLGIAGRSRDARLGVGSDEYWATVYDDGDEIVGTLFRTPPYPLSLSRMPSDAIPAVADELANVYEVLPGAVGPAGIVQSFADHWKARCGASWRVKFRQRIHVLNAVEDISGLPSGALRRMEDSDEQLILEWMDGFARDAGISVPAERFLRPLLAERKFFFWDDNGARSMVAAGRETPNGACISAVYTPGPYRRNGYATASVAAFSRELLASGKAFCCLYTDLENPTSNSIYRRIGYEPVRDDLELIFEAP